MNSIRDIWIAFSIISSSVSWSAVKNRMEEEENEIQLEIRKANKEMFKKFTHNWNHRGTTIWAVNGRIRTLALAWANFLCSMWMGRAHLGSRISAFWWLWAQGFRWQRYSDSLHSYCSATYRSFWSLHSLVQVQHCIHSTLSVALPFVDSIVVFGYAYSTQIKISTQINKSTIVWDSRIFALWSIFIRIRWSSGWWLIVAVIVNRFTRCTVIRVTTRWFRMKFCIIIRSSHTSRTCCYCRTERKQMKNLEVRNESKCQTYRRWSLRWLLNYFGWYSMTASAVAALRYCGRFYFAFAPDAFHGTTADTIRVQFALRLLHLLPPNRLSWAYLRTWSVRFPNPHSCEPHRAYA